MSGENREPQSDTQVATPETQPALETPLDDELEHPVLEGHPAVTPEESGLTEGEELSEEPETPPAEEPPRLKYKSHEEAEKAYEEAQRKMHEATTEASQLRESQEALQKEIEELKAKMEEEPPPPPPPPPTAEERKAKLLAVAKSANQKALGRIAQLDRSDDDYTEQVAEAWGEAHAEALMEAGISASSLSEDEIGKIVKRQYEAERESERKARADRAAKEQQEAGERLWQKAVTLAEDAGLNMQDRKSADYILFDSFSREIPDEYHGKPLQDQVGWVVGQVRSRVGQVVESSKQREALARRHQEDNAVLGRGSQTPRATPKTGLGSLDDDFEAVKTQRTL